MSGPVTAAEMAAESVRSVNHLTLRAPSPGTPGWEDVGDLYQVLGELRVLAERLPQACSQLARHLEGRLYEVDAMTDEPAEAVVASASLALGDAQRCASQVGEHLNVAHSAVAHLHA